MQHHQQQKMLLGTAAVQPGRVLYRPDLRTCSSLRRRIQCQCRSQTSQGHSAAALVGVGVAMSVLLSERPAEAGLLAPQPFGDAAAAAADSRVLVLDRERVELLLANEFKERLHALPNDQLVQLLDELLASQQTTAPELFADVLNRQQPQQQNTQAQSGPAEQLAGGLRKGFTQLWGFSQNRWQQNPSLAQAPTSGSSSSDAADVAPTAPSSAAPSLQPPSSSGSSPAGGWKAPWANQASSTASPAAEAQRPDLQGDTQQAVPAGQQPQSPRWQLGLLSNLQQQQQQQQEQELPAVVEDASPPAAAETRGGGVDAASTSTPPPPQQQQQRVQDVGTDMDDAAGLEDLGESDITGGLLFGKPGSGQELLAPSAAADEAGDAAAAATAAGATPDAAPTGLAGAAAAKLQGLFKWAPQLPFASQPDAAPAAAVENTPNPINADAAPAEAAAGAAAAAAAGGGGGGVLGGVSAAVAAAAGGGLKGLLELPGEVASNVEGALEDLGYEAADAVSAVLEEQGPTIAAVIGLTAAAGGGVLLLSSLLQPLLSGQLASNSKLSAMLQADAAEDNSPSSSSSNGVDTDDAEAAAAAGTAVLAAVAGTADAAGTKPDSIDATSSSSSKGRRDLLDNLGSVDMGYATAPDAAAAAGYGAAVLDGAPADGLSLSTTSSSAAGGDSSVLWQREEQPAVSPVAAAAAAAVTSSAGVAVSDSTPAGADASSTGSILWQREEASSAPVAAVAAVGSGGDGAGAASSILWEREESAAVAGDSAAASSSSSGPVLWEAGGASLQHLDGQQHLVDDTSGAAGTAAAAAATRNAGGGENKRSRKQRLLSQLLSNAEDVIEHMPELQQQQPYLSQQWWPWQQQQQPEQQQPMHAPQPPPPPPMQQQQQHWEQPGIGFNDNQSWAAAAGSSSSSMNTAVGARGQSGTPHNPKDLWPVILATSSTAFSYASLASADFGAEGDDVDVALVLPSDLPADPWDTTPAGLVPNEAELAQLGVLQAELQGLAAACRDAAVSESPWCKHTSSSSSSEVGGQGHAGNAAAAEVFVAAGLDRDGRADDEADRGSRVWKEDMPAAAVGDDNGNSQVDDRPMQVIGFFQ